MTPNRNPQALILISTLLRVFGLMERFYNSLLKSEIFSFEILNRRHQSTVMLGRLKMRPEWLARAQRMFRVFPGSADSFTLTLTQPVPPSVTLLEAISMSWWAEVKRLS